MWLEMPRAVVETLNIKVNDIIGVEGTHYLIKRFGVGRVEVEIVSIDMMRRKMEDARE